MSKISIIIPTYNQDKYLAQCLDSVLMQDFNDFEVITVNDCSTDKTVKILKRYQDNFSNLKVINNKNNIGQGESRNKGIELSTGEYIMFADSDDLVEKDALKKSYDAALKTGSDLVRFDSSRMIARIRFNKEVFNPNQKEDIGNIDIKEDNYIFKEKVNVWNKLYSRSLIGNKRFKNMRYEDLPFTMNILFDAKNITYLKENLYSYRFNPNSIMGTAVFHKNEKLLDIFNACDMLDNIKNKKGLDKEVEDLKGINCTHIINDILAWQEGTLEEKKELISYLFKATELKYGSLNQNQAYINTIQKDSFFRKRMALMNKHIIKSEYQNSQDADELIIKSKSLIKKMK